MKSQKIATSSVTLLHAAAHAGKNGYFDYIRSSEWNCSLGGQAEMPHALKRGLAHAAHSGSRKARKVKSLSEPSL